MAKRRALCVAIDDYGHPANNLNSCIADSQAFEQLLRSTYGFDEVHALHNEQATIKNVEEGLAWLFEDPTPDDRLVLHFSGHGYQRPNNDVLEEVLVLHDGFFQDDRLSELSQPLPGRNLTVVLDSCFSGGMEKILILGDEGIEVGRPKRWTPIDAQQLQKEYTELDKAVTMKLKPFGAAQPVEDPAVLSKEFGFASHNGADKATLAPAPPSDERSQLQMKGLLLSACLENETASAKTSKTNGLSAFTFGITEALKEGGPKATTSDLIATVQRRLKAMGFRQTPLMKAPPDATDLGEQSFLLFESGSRPRREGFGELDIERIMELVRNTLKEGIPMATTATQMPETQMPDEKWLHIALPIALSVVRHLTKEYQPEMGVQPSAGSPVELDEKGWRDLVSRVVPIATTVARQFLTKEYQPGMGVQPSASSSVAGGDEKLWGMAIPLAISVARHFLTKEYQPEMGVQPSAGSPAEFDEKGWRDMFSRALPIATTIARGLLTKEYQPGMGVQPSASSPAAGGDEKWLHIALPIALSVVSALRKDYQPSLA